MRKEILFFMMLVIISCASVKQNIINKDAGIGIRSWAVISLSKLDNFNNEPKIIDTSFAGQVEAYTKTFNEIIDENKDGDLISSLKFELVGEYRIPIKELKEADGIISINTSSDYNLSGLTYGTIYVRFLTKEKELIAQIKIKNDGLGTYKKIWLE